MQPAYAIFACMTDEQREKWNKRIGGVFSVFTEWTLAFSLVALFILVAAALHVGSPLIRVALQSVEKVAHVSSTTDSADELRLRLLFIGSWSLIFTAVAAIVTAILVIWRTWVQQRQYQVSEAQKDHAREKQFTDLIASALVLLAASRDKKRVINQETTVVNDFNGRVTKTKARNEEQKREPVEDQRRGAMILLKDVALQSPKHAADIVDILFAYARREGYRYFKEKNEELFEATGNASDNGDGVDEAESTSKIRLRLVTMALMKVDEIHEKMKDMKLELKNMKLELKEARHLPPGLVGDVVKDSEFFPHYLNHKDTNMHSFTWSNANVRDQNFTSSDFTGTTISGSDDKKAIFYACNFNKAKFDSTMLYDVIFDQCKFDGAEFKNAELLRVEFKNPIDGQFDLTGCSLDSVTFAGGQSFAEFNLEGAKLKNMDLTKCYFTSTKSNETKIHDVIFDQCKFHRAQFKNVDLLRVEFKNRIEGQFDLTGRSLDSVTFADGQSFAEFNLEGAKLKNLDLTKCDFTSTKSNETKIHDVIFDQCKFDRAQFKNVDLLRVEFKNPIEGQFDLTGRSLDSVTFADGQSFASFNLEGAKLKNMDLSRVKDLRQEQLDLLRDCDKDTVKLPAGLKSPAHLSEEGNA